MKKPVNIPENEGQVLDEFALIAAAEGILLVGVKDAVGPGYSVHALRADTKAPITKLAITKVMADNHNMFLAALVHLKEEALSRIVPK